MKNEGKVSEPRREWEGLARQRSCTGQPGGGRVQDRSPLCIPSRLVSGEAHLTSDQIGVFDITLSYIVLHGNFFFLVI